jgi:pimeloyl-ACP methyl ester carboxylesterase
MELTSVRSALAHATSSAAPARASSARRLEPLRHVDAGVLDIAYYEEGPADGPVVMLMHGFPYDIHSFVDVAPMLAAQGCRAIVPYLRGYGPTRFRESATPRSGEQAAVGADLIALMDAIGVKRAVLAGYDWGGRAACVAAALWPDRCTGLVSVNGYLIQNIAKAMVPARPEHEVQLWYQYYFQVERGRAGLTANRREIARILWKQWSPNWHFDDATFERTAVAHDNPDYVELPSSLRPGRRRSAICRPATPAGGAACDYRARHHLGRRRRRRCLRDRWHRERGEVHWPPYPSRDSARGT